MVGGEGGTINIRPLDMFVDDKVEGWACGKGLRSFWVTGWGRGECRRIESVERTHILPISAVGSRKVAAGERV
jgi:hypothetical protein